MGHDDCALTQMKWGISQAISLVGVSAMAQQQLHYRQKKKKKHQKDWLQSSTTVRCVVQERVDCFHSNQLHSLSLCDANLCSHCRCRKRNEELSFPCHLLHRGLCHLAGVFALEEHNFISRRLPSLTPLDKYFTASPCLPVPVSISLLFAASLSLFTAVEIRHSKWQVCKHGCMTVWHQRNKDSIYTSPHFPRGVNVISIIWCNYHHVIIVCLKRKFISCW